VTTPYQPFRAPMRALDFHPVADLFPMMSERELADLTADIREHGLREPVWLHRDGRIVDGRNRYRACLSVGVEPETRTYTGEDSALVSFVVSLNLHRRHLSESQRAMVAARIAGFRHGGDRVSEQAANLPLATQAEAAEQLQVSERSLRDARRVQTEGVPELAARVDAGEVAVSTAAEVATVAPERQRAILQQVDPREIIRAATEIKAQRREQRVADKVAAVAAITTRAQAPAEPAAAPVEVKAGQWWQLGKHLLYCGDSASDEFVSKAQGAAFAFADPPYNAGKADWDHNFEWRHDYLTEVAEVVAVTPGISAIADFFAVTRMPYRWSMAAWITNGMTRGALGFGNWIYLALFSDSASLYRNTQDHLRINVDPSTTGDTAHESRKPARLLVDLIELFTADGDVVVDPFLGSGTTLFAAEQAGRRCVGAEMNPKHSAEIIARFGPEAKLL
jgi:ParB-like chromosome segregation protein Spo0J